MPPKTSNIIHLWVYGFDIQLLRFQREELFSFAWKLYFFCTALKNKKECKWDVQIQPGVWGNPALLLQTLCSTTGNTAGQADDTLLYFHKRWILLYEQKEWKQILSVIWQKNQSLSGFLVVTQLSGHRVSQHTSLHRKYFHVWGEQKVNPLIWSASLSTLSFLAFQLELFLLKSCRRVLMKSLKKFENAQNLRQKTSRGSLFWFWTVQDKV